MQSDGVTPFIYSASRKCCTQFRRVYRSQFYRRIPNLPMSLTFRILFGGVNLIPPATSLNYIPWAMVGFLFQYLIRRRHFSFWAKYNCMFVIHITPRVADSDVSACVKTSCPLPWMPALRSAFCWSFSGEFRPGQSCTRLFNTFTAYNIP
jgi:hypothetical protein